MQVNVNVNGIDHIIHVHAGETLLYTLREQLGLSGAKKGCDSGECGACTVIMNGNAVNSCLVLTAEADGAYITTIEGLANGQNLHELQRIFIEKGAVQCGFCTPGMILAAKALLDRTPLPSEEDVRIALSGHLCRCTGYVKIVEAVMAAAQSISFDNRNE